MMVNSAQPGQGGELHALPLALQYIYHQEHSYGVHSSCEGSNNGYLRMSRESGEEDLGAAGVLRGAYSAGPVSPTCY